MTLGDEMFRRIVSAVILIPLLVILVAFAVANRHTVTVSFDPFSSTAPAYTVTVYLFVIVFVLLIAGVIVGGTAVWFGQRRIRRARRRLDAEVAALHGEIDRLRREVTSQPTPARSGREPAPPLIPPPVA
jgi:uncharacterized integral membrane protein